MKNFISLVLLLCLVMATGSCVHEFPLPQTSADVCIHLRHSTLWETSVLDIPSASRTAKPLSRYILRLYPLGMNKHPERDHVFQHIYYHAGERDDISLRLSLPAGDWELHVWSDAVEEHGAGDLYYNTSRFNEISLAGPHSGSNDNRDAFAGSAEISIPASTTASPPHDITVNLERPLSRYEFIATDFDEFIERETEKSRSPDISQYKIIFAYSGYMPSVYNRFIDGPVDSATGVIFTGHITPLGNGEASIGFDHVFSNHREGGVVVRAYLENPEGQRVGISSDITVPLRRSVNTLVRGRFLTSENKGGLNIDFEFEGDYNIYL